MNSTDDVFYDDTAEPDLASYLSKYFLRFAVAARWTASIAATATTP